MRRTGAIKFQPLINKYLWRAELKFKMTRNKTLRDFLKI